MIHLVNYENKDQYSDVLEQMFKDRKKVFVDKLDWDLTPIEEQERDEFDTKDTIYLIVMDDETGVVKSSLRLNPTTQPHLMSELFPHMCANGVPIGSNVREISRYCYNPDVTRGRKDRLSALTEIMCGVMEASLLYGWDKLTFVIGTALTPHCLACGWEIMPLGLPHGDRRDSIVAFEVKVTQQGLLAVRANAGLTEPALIRLPRHSFAA